MWIPFVKMHGAGNDFVVVDRRSGAPAPDPVPDFVHAACDRRRGIGADGVLFLDPGEEDLDFRMRYFNRDGGEADLCGNGGRCLAAYAAAMGLGQAGRLVFASPAGRHEARVTGDQVDLVLGDVAFPELARAFETPAGTVVGTLVRVGVPHVVVESPDVSQVDLASFGPVLRAHPTLGREGANVDLVTLMAPARARLRTFERGVEGETLACGTGAVAAAVALVAAGRAQAPVTLEVASGDELVVSFEREDRMFRRATLSGPVHRSFEGMYHWRPRG